ncbi:hypothetical protein [Maricaulis sp.]|uniref:hypothetical protein n=1 Tax=Maricaulis sp. TaxID=1486257 RepID=UPI002629C1DD|nr:hypothetical protein [Maricaulis sp.]MDF1768088.1 hypothetical protein [Maricaulis sp.]
MSEESLQADNSESTGGQKGRLVGISHIIAAFVWLAVAWAMHTDQSTWFVERFPEPTLQFELSQLSPVALVIALIFFVSGALILRARRMDGVTYGSR